MVTVYSNQITVSVLPAVAQCTYNISAAVGYGSGSVSPTSATITPSQSATFTATPAYGYSFLSWALFIGGTTKFYYTNPLTLAYTDLTALQPCSNSNTYQATLQARFSSNSPTPQTV